MQEAGNQGGADAAALRGRRILLVIAGGIAAYKCLDLIRRLREYGVDVRCILTRAGAEFVTPSLGRDPGRADGLHRYARAYR